MVVMLAQHLSAPAALVVSLVDKTPKPNAVVAGWVGMLVFVLLALAVAFLGWSLTRQLKKAQKAADEGKYDPSDKKPRRTSI